eukprot:10582638-Ditylum_brightwellii.AAC.1
MEVNDENDVAATTSKTSPHYCSNSAGRDAQNNQGYCGPSSVVALLSSLQIGGAFDPVGAGGSISGVSPSSFSNPNIAVALLVDTSYSLYKYATQRDFFGSCTSSHVIYHLVQLNGEDEY